MFRKFLFFLIIFSLGMGFGYSRSVNLPYPNSTIQVEKNTPKAFLSEIYDKTRDNYWDNISEAQLLDQFLLAIEKSGGQLKVAKFDNKDKLLNAISDAISGRSEEDKNKFVASVASSVLASLNPIGRSSLYTEKQEVALKNTVENRNPATGKVEPTIKAAALGNTLFVQFIKFSPTSLDEFQKTFEAYKDHQLSSLILDLRGNVGGAIDATAYFLGYFLGKNQLAFEFYHKGEYLPFKTPTDKLVSLTKYKQIVVLIDQNTQSSAEMMAAAIKKYHLGIVLGTASKGWGTVERVFPLNNQIDKTQKYSIFLVHSITLRDDNQPIEGRGVEPDVNIKDSNWQGKLFEYFRNPDLSSAVTQVLYNK